MARDDHQVGTGEPEAQLPRVREELEEAQRKFRKAQEAAEELDEAQRKFREDQEAVNELFKDKARRSESDVQGNVVRDELRSVSEAPGDQGMPQDEDPLTQVAAMPIEQLRNQLPRAQDNLDAIESDLEEIVARRDVAVIRVAAMQARLTALMEADRRESGGE